MKSFTEYLHELHALPSPITKDLAQRLFELQLKSFEDDQFIGLRRELNALLNTTSEVALTDTIYNCLVALAALKPNNEIDPGTNRPLCPLSLCEIAPENLFVSVETSTHFDINLLAQAIVRKGSFLDPMRNINFSLRDQRRIQELCAAKNLVLPANLALPPRPAPAPVSRPALIMAPQPPVNPAPAQAIGPPSCLRLYYNNLDPNFKEYRSLAYFINDCRCIRRIDLIMRSEYNSVLYIEAKEDWWLSSNVHHVRMLRDAVLQARFTSSLGREVFNESNTPTKKFKIRGNPQYIQDAFVQLLPMIKTLEGAQVFGQEEQEILNMIESFKRAPDLPLQKPILWCGNNDGFQSHIRIYTYSLNNPRYIKDLVLVKQSNNYSVSIDELSRHEDQQKLIDALEWAGLFPETRGVEKFPTNRPDRYYREKFEICGHAQYVQNALVSLIDVIKTLEGYAAFGQEEETIRNWFSRSLEHVPYPVQRSENRRGSSCLIM